MGQPLSQKIASKNLRPEPPLTQSQKVHPVSQQFGAVLRYHTTKRPRGDHAQPQYVSIKPTLFDWFEYSLQFISRSSLEFGCQILFLDPN